MYKTAQCANIAPRTLHIFQLPLLPLHTSHPSLRTPHLTHRTSHVLATNEVQAHGRQGQQLEVRMTCIGVGWVKGGGVEGWCEGRVSVGVRGGGGQTEKVGGGWREEGGGDSGRGRLYQKRPNFFFRGCDDLSTPLI